MRLRNGGVALALAGSVLGVSAVAGAGRAYASSSHRVTAVLTEFHIGLSQKSFAPGTYTFVAENKGKDTHALAISGPGLKKHDETKLLAPGKSADLTVTFKKGNYDVFCPVSNHKSLGMNVNLRVKAGGGTSTSAASSGGVGY